MADTLKSLRYQKGYTQADVANKLGVTIPTVSSWERGLSKPYPKYIPKLADILGVSAEDIFLLLNTIKLSKTS
ncbi:helix-turn-helix transcriptional regulator [Limosilactobacillus reuteri]|uniref:helix-turn-helix transcriptional regulator n=1 Tax=Limosilactobacillus reuteri TaxID=1598 RepID=UPI001E2E548E|nr:helix-turn-helix transcriptional regulator [Limosilactobacillus reuteri]MCC4467311.1 helix-turn-helix domain-containing protein [Limosilactobacillus reuteri]MCC4473998.1 helix-turn-helix domain-containing protein [Limosilactobacillus reuteri]